ncbi:alanine/ornithine racemase family PLP-dependent enzyme [Clostridium sporogenes]|uniref:ornithine racemase Orr n=1 Tax=Clostridium sporogenes TaxID=1509 RepID=UPI0013D43550|nr:ornithine racemase Orr [Clostridium sporogenes]NFV11806.1 alanine/ornithine racemase family PLP-dependent enzyme [Clostridium sporogenes]
MSYPRVEVDTKKIRYNTKIMVKECKKRGIKVAAVTKTFCGDPKIAQVIAEENVDILADSRVENLKKLKHINLPKMLLRLPMISQVEEVIKYADISLISDIITIRELSKEAVKQNKIHSIILMVDLGDLREGIFDEEEIYTTVEEILNLKGINLMGIGTNLSCYGGVIPTYDNLSQLVNIKKNIENKFNIKIDVISGGNSGSISLFKENKIPKEINQLRLGASISLGIGLNDEHIEPLLENAFKLVVEIVEVKNKPSVPIGIIGLDAFGNKPFFEDKGIMKRAICAIGRQDISPENVIPIDDNISVLGASSDHLLLDITNCNKDYKIGDQVEFNVTFGGCLSIMTSEYVNKVIL